MLDIEKLVEKNIGQAAKEKAKGRFARYFSGAFHYEFTERDIERIQTILNGLRSSITESTVLEAEHKARVLARLEKLQAELHKRESDVDKFYAFAGDMFVLVKKGGEAAQPWLECVKEVLQIVWNAQTNAYGLPSNTPMDLLQLPPVNDNGIQGEIDRTA